MGSKVWIGIVATLLLAAMAQAEPADVVNGDMWLKCRALKHLNATGKVVLIRIVVLNNKTYIVCSLKNIEATNNTERVLQTLMRVRNLLVSVNHRAIWNIE